MKVGIPFISRYWICGSDQRWIPAYAGMTVGVVGGLFSEESFMQPCNCTPWDEHVCGAEAGNHKGCPYNGFVGVYFRTNDG